MGFVLYLAAIFGRAVLFSAGYLFGFFASFKVQNFAHGVKTLDQRFLAIMGNVYRSLDQKFLAVATIIDIQGAVVCAELFNATLITRDAPVKFGTKGLTISQVIGYNLKAGTLTKTGHRVNNGLNRLHKRHTLKAIGE
jgi:hypothetical protein